MEKQTPIKAIRAKCLDCTCQQPKEVRLCVITRCALWPYRMGRRPRWAASEVLPDKITKVYVGQKESSRQGHKRNSDKAL